jgi:hypothetical protein
VSIEELAPFAGWGDVKAVHGFRHLACAKSLQKLGITHPIVAPPKLYGKIDSNRNNSPQRPF